MRPQNPILMTICNKLSINLGVFLWLQTLIGIATAAIFDCSHMAQVKTGESKNTLTTFNLHGHKGQGRGFCILSHILSRQPEVQSSSFQVTFRQLLTMLAIFDITFITTASISFSVPQLSAQWKVTRRLPLISSAPSPRPTLYSSLL